MPTLAEHFSLFRIEARRLLFSPNDDNDENDENDNDDNDTQSTCYEKDDDNNDGRENDSNASIVNSTLHVRKACQKGRAAKKDENFEAKVPVMCKFMKVLQGPGIYKPKYPKWEGDNQMNRKAIIISWKKSSRSNPNPANKMAVKQPMSSAMDLVIPTAMDTEYSNTIWYS